MFLCYRIKKLFVCLQCNNSITKKNKIMKTFKDLDFLPHPNAPYFETQAVCNFENGYGVSVVNGRGAYCDTNTFEVAVLYDNHLTYNTELTDDVMGYQSPEDITKSMEYLQNL